VVPARPGRTRRNLPADEWKLRIIQATRVLFSERGYDGTTMEDIAKLSGISRARLYRLYPGRRELFEAIIAQDAKNLAGELLLELAQAQGTPAKVRAMVTVFFRFVETRRERNRVLYSDPGKSDPALTELMRTVRNALADTFAQDLSAAIAPTTMDRDELRLMAHAVIAMAEGAATAWVSGPHLDMDRSVEIVTNVALRALHDRQAKDSG
jgi:AcrR family transcriptional regulator